jgi:hypothetical protein
MKQAACSNGPAIGVDPSNSRPLFVRVKNFTTTSRLRPQLIERGRHLIICRDEQQGLESGTSLSFGSTAC